MSPTRVGLYGIGRIGRLALRAAWGRPDLELVHTMVTDGTQVKVLAWCETEWGYSNRLIELAGRVAAGLRAAEGTAAR